MNNTAILSSHVPMQVGGHCGIFKQGVVLRDDQAVGPRRIEAGRLAEGRVLVWPVAWR